MPLGQELQYEFTEFEFERQKVPAIASAEYAMCRDINGLIMTLVKIREPCELGSPMMAGAAEWLADFRRKIPPLFILWLLKPSCQAEW